MCVPVIQQLTHLCLYPHAHTHSHIHTHTHTHTHTIRNFRPGAIPPQQGPRLPVPSQEFGSNANDLAEVVLE